MILPEREAGERGAGAWTQAAPEAKTAAAKWTAKEETLSLAGQCNLRVTDFWLTSRVIVSAHIRKYDGGRARTFMCLQTSRCTYSSVLIMFRQDEEAEKSEICDKKQLLLDADLTPNSSTALPPSLLHPFILLHSEVRAASQTGNDLIQRLRG